MSKWLLVIDCDDDCDILAGVSPATSYLKIVLDNEQVLPFLETLKVKKRYDNLKAKMVRQVISKLKRHVKKNDVSDFFYGGNCNCLLREL